MEVEEEEKEEVTKKQAQTATGGTAMGALAASKEFNFKAKDFTKLDSPTAKLTKWIEVTIKDIQKLMEYEQEHFLRKKDAEETCPICMCELYEGLSKMTEEEVEEAEQEMLEDPEKVEVVCMERCKAHAFHKDCLIR